MMVLIPAYGRDYKSQAAALKDFNDDKDFRVASMEADGYTNHRDLQQLGVKEVAIRYNKQKMKFFVKIEAKTQTA